MVATPAAGEDSAAWLREVMSLALARHFGPEAVAADGLVMRVARGAPEALIRAARHSGLLSRPHSPRRVELDRAASESEAVAELCQVLDVLTGLHRERVAALDAQKAQTAELPGMHSGISSRGSSQSPAPHP